MVMPTRARDACPCPKSYGHGVKVSGPAVVPLAILADCCIVGPHRARNACHWESYSVHSSGHARVLPAGGWSGFDMWDEHVMRVDIVVARVMAWH
jgi:hypothetical protein